MTRTATGRTFDQVIGDWLWAILDREGKNLYKVVDVRGNKLGHVAAISATKAGDRADVKWPGRWANLKEVERGV